MNTLSQPANIRDSLPARESVMRLEAGDLLYDHSGGSSYVIVEPRSGQAEVTNRFDVVVYEGPEARLYQALQLSRAGKTLRDPARVALKIAISHGFNGQISAEAQRQSQLSQRAKGEVIAPVIDQGEHQGHVFYTTPWYSQTLDSWLEQAAPNLIQRLGALARLCQATTALHTADAQGLRIVHGDIKPQNIAILAEGPRQILRFLDLGTTRQTSERTVGPLGARAYSLGYSPPGQLIPGAPTLRSDDAFAVAACLFRALSGHRPACASLDYRAAIRRDAPWEQTDKAGDPALFFRLKVFYELLEGQDLPRLQEQVSEEALKALQAQDDGAQDPALAQHQQALAQQVAERLVTLLRDGLQPEPRKRRQDWLEDAALELEALVALLLAPPQEQRPPAPPPSPLPQPAPRHGGWSLAAGLGLGVALTLMVQMPWSQRWAGQEGAVEEAPVGEVAGTLAPEPAAPAAEEQPLTLEPPEPVVKPPTPVAAAPTPTPTPAPAPRGPLRPALVSVQRGTLDMGSPEEALTWKGDREAYEDELPQRALTIPAFQMCKTEVTQAHYEAVMGTNPSTCGAGCGDNLPVQNVSWYDAVAYLNRLTELESEALVAEGKSPLSACYTGSGADVRWVSGCTGYRLPTEAEWEYAARAGTTTSWSFGKDPADIGEYAWYSGNAWGRVHAVGDKENKWGLSDMYGNVWEWVWDSYESYDSYKSGEVVNSSGTTRALRGGSFLSAPRRLRSANRLGVNPEGRSGSSGFRCARSSDPQR